MEMDPRWKALGELLRYQRVRVLGFPKRAAFMRHLGLTNDRVLGDLELGRRDNYDIDTLISLESWYGLTSEQLRGVMGDLYPLHDVATVHAVATIQSQRTSAEQTMGDLRVTIDQMRSTLDAMQERLDQWVNTPPTTP